MTTTIDLKDTDDLQEVLYRKCKCGHMLYEHGFIELNKHIHTSQCVICEFDKEKQKFKCEGFVQE